jgi:dimethylaniline monooxygenase (N-oxide forming)
MNAEPRQPEPPADHARGVPSVCLIGAGSSGLPVIKALAERGIAVDCFERSDRVGGNWAFRNPNDMSAAYRSLHTNSSRTRTQYADFPMPAGYPDYPHHSQMARYFEAYAGRFGLGRRIAFGTTVRRARRGDGGWLVTLEPGGTRRYDVLVVANGHHWKPRCPEPPHGRFDGPVIHSHDYVDPAEPLALAGRAVVVVGLGNSAADIAVELAAAGAAGRVYLSVRRGAWILPKHVAGRPVDRLAVTNPRVPWRVQSLLARATLLATGRGRPRRLGLPRPDHPPLAAHPTVSEDLPDRLRRGDVVAKPPIARFGGRTVHFADGGAVEADAIIYCTGYEVSFPFFGREIAAPAENDFPLWRRLARPGETDLFFVGLLQPLGAIMPLAEAQAKLIAAALAGDYAFPDQAAMQRDLARERDEVRRRYVASPRHTMQVDFDRYLWELQRELAAGRERARVPRRNAAA